MEHKIGWLNIPGTTGETWNPITGCTKVSEGCKHCYAERMSKRLAGRFGYPADEPFRVTLHTDRLEEPLRWRKPRTVFVCSMGDLFHEDVGDATIQQVFTRMKFAPRHTFIVLTKRADRMLAVLTAYSQPGWGQFGQCRNIWLGVTAENQQRADERIPLLLQCPAAVRFVSIEPMLGAVNILDYVRGYGRFQSSTALDWIIVGGETGPGARPMQADWARSVRDQCKAASVPFFFKQMPKRAAIPDDLMIREWPEVSR